MLSDTNAENRKKDHIELAFQSQVENVQNDPRFYYEPLLSEHPTSISLQKTFVGRKLQMPLWISSMTGGTQLAGKINHNLAKACNEFGIGMGLGSCRRLLYDDTFFNDFNLRPVIGKDLPFYANLGIAQIEKSIADNQVDEIKKLVDKLQADGLIIHVNPMQEFLQPEGDRFKNPPLHTIQQFLNLVDFPVIVKEVGQGMGPESLKALLQLPIVAIDFGAYGGTNFSKVELLRSSDEKNIAFDNLMYVGHTAQDMINFVNDAINELGEKVLCKEIIVSGGIKNFLDGYYYMHKLNLNSIYAQGSAFLKYAQNSYEELKTYIESQRDGLALCGAYLKVK
ncbi:MAG: type 2 isopentenyl-diphosphate Delta-isomerase [Fimbriimonadaceae bacterium]|nr:type 2 isopentenyl-diphosphate Delta-isomerase [Chitinophagales bacterium]